jgi:DNA replication and repair protein RecF
MRSSPTGLRPPPPSGGGSGTAADLSSALERPYSYPTSSRGKGAATDAAAIERDWGRGGYSLTLTDFRSYERARPCDGRAGASVYLFGANGAGKTNLLEAISLLSPGKGLRGSSLAEVGRRLPGETTGRAWAVAAEVESGEDEPVRLGTGVELAGAARRIVRIEGETVPPGRLADHIRPIWLTPAQDRLFLEAAGERRRFFDRLVFAGEPDHARHANAYDKAQRERMRLLTDAGRERRSRPTRSG